MSLNSWDPIKDVCLLDGETTEDCLWRIVTVPLHSQMPGCLLLGSRHGVTSQRTVETGKNTEKSWLPYLNCVCIGGSPLQGLSVSGAFAWRWK